MLSTPQTIAPKPAALPPTPQAAAAPGGTAGGPSFAQFLNDAPVVTTPPPEHADPIPRKPESANSASAAPAPAPALASAPAQAPIAAPVAARRPATPAVPSKPAPTRSTDAAAEAEPKTAAKTKDAGDAMTAMAAATDKDKADQADTPETSGLNEFTQLIGLTPQALPVPSAPVAALPGTAPAAGAAEDEAPAARHGRPRITRLADDAGSTPAATRGSAEMTATPAGEQRRPAEAPARDATAHAKSVDLAAATDKAAARSVAGSESLQAVTAAATGGASTPQAGAASATPSASFAAVLAQAMPMAATTADASPVSAGGQVRAAVNSSAFAPELAARVSLLAVDGVQQAELQLHPADMGPVAVQIVVDGAQAQVSFHAAQAETRQALEQSLPDLAAALQSQGLTLSGGGVFQQASRDAQDRDNDAGQADGRGSRGNGSTARVGVGTAAPTPALRRSVGLLDTFA